MKNVVIVRGARQLLTLRGPGSPRRGAALRELSIIQDGALLVRDGLIAHAGPSRRIDNLAEARGAPEINAGGRVVMPAFVDCDAQIVFAHSALRAHELRSSSESDSRPGELRDAILAGSRALRSVSTRPLVSRAQSVVSGMIRHGTCTIEAKSGYGLDSRGEIKALRVQAALDRQPLDIVSTYLGANILPPDFESNPDTYLRDIIERQLPAVARRRLARFAAVRCGPLGFTQSQARQYLEAAKRLGLGVKLYAGQFPGEGAVALAAEMGAVSIAHLDHIARADIGLLGQSAVTAVLLPAPVFQLGLDRYAPAREMIDAGAAVALGSHFNPDTSPTYNMQLVLSLACRHLNMSPAEAITAATINAAHVVGHAHRAGSLEPGKNADLLILNAGDYREIPYHVGINHVHMTMKRGTVIYREGGIANWLTA